MKDKLLHTPDGVRDIYNGECQKKLFIQDKLHQTMHSFGYQDIQTPTFEFFNIFGNEIGTTPSRDLYKFFDKEGNTLVLRPDFTPSIARSAVKYFSDQDMPVKLCYQGNTFINSSDYQGRLKETTQSGAELIGDSSISADAEILAMICQSFLACGLKNFQISVGHSRFFTGLTQAAGITDDSQLRELIQNKNFFGVEEYIDELQLSDDLKKLFEFLRNFDLKDTELEEARRLSEPYKQLTQALDELILLKDYLKLYNIDRYISYELGIISEYHYYTGIIFAGYTFGTGEAIVKGGRYDKLLLHFGRNIPAIGFAIVVDQLSAALSRQNIDLPIDNKLTLVVFKPKRAKEAIGRATDLRGKGIPVQLIEFDDSRDKDYYSAYARANKILKLEFIED